MPLVADTEPKPSTRAPTAAGKARLSFALSGVGSAYQCSTPKRCIKMMTVIGTPSSHKSKSRAMF
jgi:hypothetical protein